MFRLALLALGLTVVVLVALSLLPQRKQATPGGTIALSDARVTLYPQADPQAVWHFAAEQVDYEPDVQETVLHDIKDAERTVGGKTDFTLASKRLVIDAQENLRGQRLEVYIPEAKWTLDMRSKPGTPVFIDQQEGRFSAPFLDISGPDISSRAQDAGMDFDLKNFTSGGEGTQNSDSFRDNADQP